MYNTSFIKKFLLALSVVFLYSCDKDFNAIGDGLIGDDHFGLTPEKYDVVAYNQEVTPVQSNNMPVNSLGIYDDPVFGTTTANFVTQLSLASYAPTIGETPVIESAVLNIPYYSHATAVDAKGGNVYKLDSIFGKPEGKLKLTVLNNSYQMRGTVFSGGTEIPQLYYTDQKAAFEEATSEIPVTVLNDTLDKKQNSQFFFDVAQLKDSTYDATTKKYTVTYSAPGMRLNLNKAFFQKNILSASAAKLATADVFQEYFRGLYFKVEKSEGYDTNLAMMNFGKGTITIKYKAKTASTTDGDAKELKTLVLNLTAGTNKTVNFLQNVRKTEYETALANPNKTVGDERLYLKGGQGSLAVVELKGFGAQLEALRKTNWMVNEANLVFHIDAAKMAVKGTDGVQASEPRRVYLYDFTNSIPVVDWSADGTSNSAGTKLIYSGIINVDATTKRGSTYKIRITNHIRNLIKTATAVNVKLGLVVTDDVSLVTSNALKNRIQTSTNPVEYFSLVPRASVMNVKGTVLYGGTASAGDNKLQLEVYYTKPN